ncbi:hypothetical protein NKH56_25480 [Mesorhizobium sp. M1076]|uniref:hypothetical protein n=1 Tax=Mesorhizobium sp. M1076 TaxID=2957054 RepID=UPI0033352A72
MNQRAIDIVDITDKFPIVLVAREVVAEILRVIDTQINESDRLRYSVFIDLARSNLKRELDEKAKNEYGSFVNLVSDTIGDEYSYDRDFLFLLWALVTRKRWVDAESINDWMFEVVEVYFQRRGWEVDDLYRNVFDALSSRG